LFYLPSSFGIGKRVLQVIVKEEDMSEKRRELGMPGVEFEGPLGNVLAHG